jgi:hypothetical protein
MIGMRIDKSMFFDSRKVMSAVDRATRKVFGHFGGMVRKTAIKSVKTRARGSSSPGQPPFDKLGAKRREENRRRKALGRKKAKAGFKGLKHILYAYEPVRRSVIIGPASNRTRSLTIPEILEEGKLDTAQRPFMGPAFQQAKQKLPGMWANSVK